MNTKLIDRESTIEDSQKLGLSDFEFHLICEKIGRTPTFTELAMFSGMWSEHCSYKNSILLLRKLYAQSDLLLAKPGEENAGALRINDKYAIVFKVESHNHPSAIEPYQGAATGVGGIMRDIFTMGARPLVSLNSLRFGPLDEARNRYLFREVVKGIGDYGNSLGIACAGGEIVIDKSYSKNPLVNAMVVGIAEIDNMASAQGGGVGNLVMYVGAKTGRDGIHGASFASKDLSKESEEERSAVQVGDPFMEKLVMEATLECIEKKLVVAIQDMGAAGLISSSSEMSSSGDVGFIIHLDKVPAREQGMLPFEYLLSESQERMLMVVEPKKEQQVIDVYKKWNLDAVEIGVVTAEKRLKIYFNSELYANIPVHSLTVNADGAPRYQRESSRPENLTALNVDVNQSSLINDFDKSIREHNNKKAEGIVTAFLSHTNLASKHAVYQQYDTDIGNGRIIGPGSNGSVYRLPEGDEALAVTIDGNSFYVAIEPYQGSMLNVCEAYRNISATGAKAIGITNCLNFANPYKPENFYFFEKAVTAMSDAAEQLELPITGGNVSFYNESEDGPVLPTPTIGMVGLLENYKDAIGIQPNIADTLFLIGKFAPKIGCSRYYAQSNNEALGGLPDLDLQEEINSAKAIQLLNADKLIHGCIDLSFGGCLTAILRMLFQLKTNNIDAGFTFENPMDGNLDLFLFGETAHCYIIAIEDSKIDSMKKIFAEHPLDTLLLGNVTENNTMKINNCELDVENIYQHWYGSLEKVF